MITTRPCPICKQAAARIDPVPDKDAARIQCGRCGTFVIDADLLGMVDKKQLSTEDEQLLPYLSAYIRELTDHGALVTLDVEDWRALARAQKRISRS
jgi:hypothetical protein